MLKVSDFDCIGTLQKYIANHDVFDFLCIPLGLKLVTENVLRLARKDFNLIYQQIRHVDLTLTC